MDQVVVLVTDALAYREAISETGMDHLADVMAREPGVEYIVYQTTDGMVFSSGLSGALPAVTDEPYLIAALDADSIVERIYDYQGRRVLELVRPFSTALHPFGHFISRLPG